MIGVGGIGALYADDSPSVSEGQKALFGRASLRIVSNEGQDLEFNVELANSPAARRRGLMFRKTLAPDHGMLFDFHVPRPVGMWMSNTYVPLDMLFAKADGQIVYIAHDTTPLSEKVISAPEKVRYVLELAAGTARRLGVRVGDRLEVLD